MIKKNVRWLIGAAALAVLLGGCASVPSSDETLTSSADETSNQKLAQIRLQLAVGYFSQRQIPTALDEIKKSLQADPNFADAHSMRGLIYMEMGESRLAEESFLQALRLAPNSPDFSNNYGWFLCQNNRERESIPYFEAAAKNLSYRSPGRALHNAGICSLKMKDTVAAERYFSRAFELDPANISTNQQLAQIYHDRGDYERARFYIRRVLNAEVMTADVLWLAIKIEHKLGDQAAKSSLATQLRRRHGGSPEFAAYQRGAFNE